MDRNRITRTGARTPGEERHRPLEWRCLERTTAPTQSGDQQVGKRRARRKDANHEGATIGRHSWEGPFAKPTLKPYWGKPAVRNFREDDGNVGIIRSPVRAIALPDHTGPRAAPWARTKKIMIRWNLRQGCIVSCCWQLKRKFRLS